VDRFPNCSIAAGSTSFRAALRLQRQYTGIQQLTEPAVTGPARRRDLAVAFLGSQEWNGLSVPVEDLGSIELIRGPGSALYGPMPSTGRQYPDSAPREIAGGRFSWQGASGMPSHRHPVRRQRGSLGYKINAGRSQGKSWSASRLTYPFEYPGFNPFLNSRSFPSMTIRCRRRTDPCVSTMSTRMVRSRRSKGDHQSGERGAGDGHRPYPGRSGDQAVGPARVLHRCLQPPGLGCGEPPRAQISLSTGLPLEEKSLPTGRTSSTAPRRWMTGSTSPPVSRRNTRPSTRPAP